MVLGQGLVRELEKELEQVWEQELELKRGKTFTTYPTSERKSMIQGLVCNG